MKISQHNNAIKDNHGILLGEVCVVSWSRALEPYEAGQTRVSLAGGWRCDVSRSQLRLSESLR